MDKELQLAEARKLLKKFRAKNAKKATQVSKSSPPLAEQKNSLLELSSPLPVTPLVNGILEHEHDTSGQQNSSQASGRESGKQPLNSTPNEKSSIDGSSLPTLLNIGKLDSSNAAMLNGSLPNYLTPSPIPKSGHSGGVASGDLLLATPGSKESSPLSRTSSSGEGVIPKYREGRDTRYHLINHGINELGKSNLAKENGKERPAVVPTRGGVGGLKFSGEVFSGATQGGVLIDHLRYLPDMDSGGAPSEARTRVGAGSGGKGVADAGGIGYRDDRITGARDRLVGRYAMEEEITELEQKVKIHAQTIDILVSEKSSLQSELRNCKSQLSGKSRECMDSDMKVKSVERKLAKLESDASTLTSDLSKRQRELEAVRGDKAELHRSLDRLRSTLEDQREEGTELMSKVTAQSAEIVQLKEVNTDLQSKLSLKELLLSQQQSGDKPAEVVPAVDHTLSVRLRECEGRADQLQQDLNYVMRQRDQANMDLRITQESLVQLREDNSKKLFENEKELGECRNQAALLKKEMEKLSLDKQVLEKKLSTEHAQMEHSFQSVTETLKEERDQLAKQLENNIQENVNLVKKNTEAETSVLEMSIKMSRLEEQSVDHDNIMRTITQDKEALSRAMSQNKELKANNMELQEAFVRLSNQNMELATELDSERRRLGQLKAHQATPPPSEAPPTSVSMPAAEVAPETPSTGITSEGESTAAGGYRSVLVEGYTQTDGRAGDAVDAGRQRDGSDAEIQRYTQVLELERSELQVQVESLQADKQLLQNELRQALLNQSSVWAGAPSTPDLSPHQTTADMEISERKIKEEDVAMSLPAEGRDGVAVPAADMDRSAVMSPLQLTELQTSFDALQMKFVSLMREKADLLDLLEEHKLLLTAAAQQAEEMGDKDSSMYQRECEALRHQFTKKDAFIGKLQAEKATMQSNIGQLQVLMRRIITEQKSTRPHPSTSPATKITHHYNHRHPNPKPGIVGPSHSSPAVVPQATVPAHLRPQLFDGDTSLPPEASIVSGMPSQDLSEIVDASVGSMPDITGASDFLGVSDEGSRVTNETAEQIIELLDRLERSGGDGVTSGRKNGTTDFMMYCTTCTGQLQSI